MSRYTQNTQKNRISYAWGFDHALGYFFSKFDEKIDDEEDDNVVFSISSHFTLIHRDNSKRSSSYSNGEILQAMEEEETLDPELKIPEEHKEAIAMDIPF